ncbi:MAG: 16S rRNA (uracil(1498)-N(3))-methyltransferase [Xanthobacter sp.]
MPANYDFRAQRLHVPQDLAAGAQIVLPAEQAHYVLHVIRLPVEGAVLLFNGRDGEWRAVRQAGGKREARFMVEERVRPQPPAPTREYAFSPLKHARLDYMVQKAVEMGAGVLTPVLTRYTQVSRINLERMAANAVEAAEQCGLLALPVINAPRPLQSWFAELPADHNLVFCDEGAEEADPIAALRGAPAGPVSVLIGPEGGFSSEERTMLSRRAITLSLGPRILRADTAAVAALALVEAAGCQR